MDDLFRQCTGENREPFGAQLGGRLEAPVVPQIVAEKAVDRARDVAADRVDGFFLATVTVGAARIAQTHAGRPEPLQHFTGSDRPDSLVHLEVNLVDLRRQRRHRLARRLPRL